MYREGKQVAEDFMCREGLNVGGFVHRPNCFSAGEKGPGKADHTGWQLELPLFQCINMWLQNFNCSVEEQEVN